MNTIWIFFSVNVWICRPRPNIPSAPSRQSFMAPSPSPQGSHRDSGGGTSIFKYLPMQVATLHAIAINCATNIVQSSAPAVLSSIHRVYSRRPNTSVEIHTSVADTEITSRDRDSESSIVDTVSLCCIVMENRIVFPVIELVPLNGHYAWWKRKKGRYGARH